MKQLPLSLAIVAAIALSACGGSSSPDEAPKDPKSPTIPSQTAQPTQQTSAENTAETPTKQEPTATPQKPATSHATTASSVGRGGSSYAGGSAGSTSSASTGTDQTKDKEQTAKTDETPKDETTKTDDTQKGQDETTKTDETQEGQDETTQTDESDENHNPAPEQPADQLTQAEFETLNAKFSKQNLLFWRNKNGEEDKEIKSKKVAPDGENVLTFKEIEETLNSDLQYSFMFKPEANKGFVSKEETYGQYSITADKNGQTKTEKHFLSQKFSYSRFGKRMTSIKTGTEPAQNSYNFYSYGDLTPLTKEKGNVLTGQANYVGNAYLDTVASTPADKKSYITDFKAEVDFDENSLEGTFLNFRQYDSQSLFSDHLADNFGKIAKKEISDSEIDDAAKTFKSTIRGNTFRTVSDAKEVVVNGRFYGADGEEIGGIINTDKIQGAFGGQKAEAASEQ